MSPAKQRQHANERGSQPTESGTQPLAAPGRRTSPQRLSNPSPADEEEDALVNRPTTEWRIPTASVASTRVRHLERPSATHDPYSGGDDWQPRTPNRTIELLSVPSDAVEVEPSTGHTIELLTLPDDVVDVTPAMPAEPIAWQGTPESPQTSGPHDLPAVQRQADRAGVRSGSIQAAHPWMRLLVEACLVGAAASAVGALLAYAMR